MADHETAEMRRLPLDSVVLELMKMMGKVPVVPVLEVLCLNKCPNSWYLVRTWVNIHLQPDGVDFRRLHYDEPSPRTFQLNSGCGKKYGVSSEKSMLVYCSMT